MAAWIRPAGLLLLALAGAAEVSAAERAGPKPAAAPEAVDAEMLKDLDLLSSPDYARDREVAHRMGFLQRLRMLESQRVQDATAPTTAPGKDTR